MLPRFRLRLRLSTPTASTPTPTSSFRRTFTTTNTRNTIFATGSGRAFKAGASSQTRAGTTGAGPSTRSPRTRHVFQRMFATSCIASGVVLPFVPPAIRSSRVRQAGATGAVVANKG